MPDTPTDPPSDVPVPQTEGGAGAHVYDRPLDPAVRSSLSVIAAWIPPGATVLDLGTGPGILGRHLRQARGCTVDGVTRDAEERRRALPWYRQLVLADLEQSSWHEPFASTGSYDAIVCADVLEHLREPAEVLRACRPLLAPDGRLLVSVPNVAYAGMTAALMHGQWRAGDEGLLDRTHLRFFTRSSFERLLAETGWRAEAAEPIDEPWHHTEFWNRLDHLPPAVARYLYAQPGASAYQWVFAARPAAAPASPDPADAARNGDRDGGKPPAAATLPSTPPPDPTVHVAAFASTVYHGSPADPQASHALGRIGLPRQTLRFALRPPAGRSPGPWLRWDPADRPGLLRLQRLTLRDDAGRTRWQWEAGRDGDAPLQPCRRGQLTVVPGPPTAPHVVLVLTGEDPQIDLPVPPHAWDAQAPAGGDEAPDEAAGDGTATGSPAWWLEIDCGWPQSADYLALSAATGPRALLQRDETVEIVVPVHGGLEWAQRCIDSVRRARCATPWRLTVIDDASPDPAVGRWLDALSRDAPALRVWRQSRNLGFVQTANHGLRLAGRRDAVLLNSDTEVADGWLDRLRRAAHAAPRTASATPFSNNATICSWPLFCQDNPLPPGWDTARLDALFARANAAQVLEIPTAVGFCMYLRRDALDDVGEFDEAAFGAGYGEENDWCRRAVARGWHHVHALDVFVRHAGGASFGAQREALQAQALAALRRLHPDYEAVVQAFVARDPARDARQAVQRQLAPPAQNGGDAARDGQRNTNVR